MVENLGSEHVLHVEYGDEAAAGARPAPARPKSRRPVHVRFELQRALLIHRDNVGSSGLGIACGRWLYEACCT